LDVLVAWEPILPTDWQPPTTETLARIHAAGVEQFWDKNHLVAQEISRELASDPDGPKPSCCTSRGIMWDLPVLFPKGAHWERDRPKAIFADGPVAKVQEPLRDKLRAVISQQN
jgi:hypothetical protein